MNVGFSAVRWKIGGGEVGGAGDGRAGGCPKTNDLMIQMLYFAAINEPARYVAAAVVCRVAARGRTGRTDTYNGRPRIPYQSE